MKVVLEKLEAEDPMATAVELCAAIRASYYDESHIIALIAGLHFDDNFTDESAYGTECKELIEKIRGAVKAIHINSKLQDATPFGRVE